MRNNHLVLFFFLFFFSFFFFNSGWHAILERASHHRGGSRGFGNGCARSGVSSAYEALQEGWSEDQMPGNDSDCILEIERAQHRGWKAPQDARYGEQGDKGARPYACGTYLRR